MMITGERKQEYLDFFNAVLSVNFELDRVKMITDIDDKGDPQAVAVFNNCNDSNCEISIASNGYWKASRRFIYECFKYMFITCGLNRVTAIVEESNHKALDFDTRIGFEREFDGVLTNWFGMNNHGVVLVMHKDKCKWIRKES